MKILYINGNIDHSSFLINKNKIVIIQKTKENLTGFKTEYGSDFSSYTHKFNILTEYDDVIMLTNDPDFVETEDNPASNYYTPVTPEMEELIIKQRKEDLIESSKSQLQEFLQNNPIELTIPNHGTALYSVTKEKQDQMFQTLSSYRTQKEFFEDAKLLWNASGEEMEEWTEEDFLNLIYQVNLYIKPRVKKQQRIEKDILLAENMNDLEMYEDIDYSTIE